jgi:hypothetical protein
MTGLDERLREALRADPQHVDVEGFLAEVHRGGRRRRARRIAAATAAGVAAATVGLLVVSALGGPPEQTPAPPGPSPVGTSQLMAPREDPAGRLYGVGAPTEDCGCSGVLWREDDNGVRVEVHQFAPDLNITLVEFAADTRSGFALDVRSESEQMWLRTTDGGRTWTEETYPLAEVSPPTGRGPLYPPDVAFLDDSAFFFSVGEEARSGAGVVAHLWTTPLAGDDWQEPDVPVPAGELDDVARSVGVLEVVEGSGTTRLAMLEQSGFTTTSDGVSWTSVERQAPCANGEPPVMGLGGLGTVFVGCPVGDDGVQLFRSVQLGEYEAIGGVLPLPADAELDIIPVAQATPGALALVRTEDRFVLLGPGSAQQDATVPESLLSSTLAPTASTVGHGDGRSYVLTSSGVVVTTADGGLTWSEFVPTLPWAGDIAAGTYRVPASAWSVAEFTLWFPEGWMVQYGHIYSTNENTAQEVVLHPVVVDEIFTHACVGEAVPRSVGPQVMDLVDALAAQPGPQVSDPVETTLGGYPAWRLDLTVPPDLDLTTCRIGENGLQVWYSARSDDNLVVVPDGTVRVYVVDVDGVRQVFITQHRDAALEEDLGELTSILDSIRIGR